MLYLLLDIDGTILPAHTDNPRRDLLKINLKITDQGVDLTFYADLIDTLRELSRQPNCEIIMCTSWGKTSLDIANALDIQANQYLSFTSDHPEHWYKWDSIVAFCTAHPQDKVILCDDLANKAATPYPPRNLVKIFQPNPIDGLALKDIRKIQKYLKTKK